HDPRPTQGPGYQVPTGWIRSPLVLAESRTRKIAGRHDLVAVIFENDFRLADGPTAFQSRGNGFGRAGKLQQDAAVHGVDRRRTGKRGVAFASIDSGGFRIECRERLRRSAP